VHAAKGAPGTLDVTVTDAGAHNNIKALQFGTNTNGLVSIPGYVSAHQGSNFTVNLVPSVSSLSFTVAHAGTGATNVSFTVVDGCGSWPTFVGGGAQAF
jgi:hypothetical protein